MPQFGENHHRFQNEAIRIKKYLGCGEVINWYKDYRKRAISSFIKQKYCSKKCSDIYGFRYEGKNHSNFKINSRKKTNRGKENSWRKKVISRDKAICQHCYKSGKNIILVAHHIKSFENYPKLRWSVENGLTLCIDCHYKVHGYKDIKETKIIKIKNNRRLVRVKKTCGFCMEELFIVPSDLIITGGVSKGKRKRNFYCNKICMGKHYKITRS